jgi:L-seryl-tRNA(Ser) seleniumtransferase
LRSNPVLRALRVDKMTLAALGATLQIYRGGALAERVPTYRMIGATLDELRARAGDYLAEIPGAKIVESDAYVGGGALAQERIASVAVALPAEAAASLAARLRKNAPPIVARIAEGRVLLDLRTIAPEEDPIVIEACRNFPT